MYWILLFLYILFFTLIFVNIDAKKYIIFIVITLSILAYNFDPIYAYSYGESYYTDLIRIFNEMESFRQLNDEYLYESAPLSRAYIWLFAMLNNDNLLILFTCIFVYTIGLSSIYKIGKRNKCSNRIILFSIFMSVSLYNYLLVISNIRYLLALTIFFVILYLDLVNRKKLYWIGYVIDILFHPGIILFVIIRFLITNKIKYTVLFLFFIYLCFNFFIENIFSILINISDVFFSGLQSKMLVYKEISNFSQPILSFYVFSIIQLVTLSIVIYDIKKYITMDYFKGYERFVNMGIIIIIISVLLLSNYQIFYRITAILYLYLPVVSMLDLMNLKIQKKKYTAILRYIIFYILILVNLVYYFGQKYGYHILMFSN